MVCLPVASPPIRFRHPFSFKNQLLFPLSVSCHRRGGLFFCDFLLLLRFTRAGQRFFSSSFPCDPFEKRSCPEVTSPSPSDLAILVWPLFPSLFVSLKGSLPSGSKVSVVLFSPSPKPTFLLVEAKFFFSQSVDMFSASLASPGTSRTREEKSPVYLLAARFSSNSSPYLSALLQSTFLH